MRLLVWRGYPPGVGSARAWADDPRPLLFPRLSKSALGRAVALPPASAWSSQSAFRVGRPVGRTAGRSVSGTVGQAIRWSHGSFERFTRLNEQVRGGRTVPACGRSCLAVARRCVLRKCPRGCPRHVALAAACAADSCDVRQGGRRGAATHAAEADRAPSGRTSGGAAGAWFGRTVGRSWVRPPRSRVCRRVAPRLAPCSLSWFCVSSSLSFFRSLDRL